VGYVGCVLYTSVYDDTLLCIIQSLSAHALDVYL